MDKNQILKQLPIWMKNHPCSEDTWWHVTNAIGDIVGWPDWYSEFIKVLEVERMK